MLFETKITYIFKSEEKPKFPIRLPAPNSLKDNNGIDVAVPEEEETRGSSAKETSHNDGNIEGSDEARGGKEEGKDEGQNNNQGQGKKLRPPAESNSNNESEDSDSGDSNRDEESQRGSDSNDSDHGSDGSNDLGDNAKRYLAGGQLSGDNSIGGNNNQFGSSSSQNNDAGSGDDDGEGEWSFEDVKGVFDNYQ